MRRREPFYYQFRFRKQIDEWAVPVGGCKRAKSKKEKGKKAQKGVMYIDRRYRHIAIS
jgi:hypothetical protein